MVLQFFCSSRKLAKGKCCSLCRRPTRAANSCVEVSCLFICLRLGQFFSIQRSDPFRFSSRKIKCEMGKGGRKSCSLVEMIAVVVAVMVMV